MYVYIYTYCVLSCVKFCASNDFHTKWRASSVWSEMPGNVDGGRQGIHDHLNRSQKKREEQKLDSHLRVKKRWCKESTKCWSEMGSHLPTCEINHEPWITKPLKKKNIAFELSEDPRNVKNKIWTFSKIIDRVISLLQRQKRIFMIFSFRVTRTKPAQTPPTQHTTPWLACLSSLPNCELLVTWIETALTGRDLAKSRFGEWQFYQIAILLE